MAATDPGKRAAVAAGSGELKRSLGFVSLCFIAISGMIGEGWLFAPMLVAQAAGPAAISSWIIGGIAMLLIAICFAEISGMLPVALRGCLTSASAVW